MDLVLRFVLYMSTRGVAQTVELDPVFVGVYLVYLRQNLIYATEKQATLRYVTQYIKIRNISL